MNPHRFARVLFIGFGLMGGSLALAMKRLPHSASSSFYVLDAAFHQAYTPKLDAENSAHHPVTQSFADMADIPSSLWARLDLVVLAVPLAQYPAVLAGLAARVAEHTLLTDLGSTKKQLLTELLPQYAYAARFVAAHPIAGSDKSGFTYANAAMFEGQNVMVCPQACNHANSVDLISQLWRDVGANVVHMSADAHDEVFSLASHLPHVLAFRYMSYVAGQTHGKQAISYSGKGFADFTRIAASHPQIWCDIVLSNRQAVARDLSAWIASLQGLLDEIARGDAHALLAQFEQARSLRQSL